jgi:hypothetical protein
MAVTHPKLAKEYQGDATKIVAGTHQRLDWKCSICEHEWKTSGKNRSGSLTGCGYCSRGDLHIDGRNSWQHPSRTKEYLGDANKVTAGTNKKLDWKCSICA